MNNPIQCHRLTNQRRLLMQLLHENERHIDAKELYLKASAIDRSISPATVYRNLNLFKEIGLLDEIRLGRDRCYYEIKRSPEHQHLVCQGCGKVLEFQNPYFGKLLEEVQREYNFNVTKPGLYLEGYCSECEDKVKIQ